MNWADEVDKRRRRFMKLAAAKRLCVESGDRVAVAQVSDCMRRARDRLLYAEKMDYFGAGLFTPAASQFATRENPPNNPAGTGS